MRNDEYSVEVLVERNLVALIIGKGGNNIKEVQNRYGVNIIVDKDEANNAN